MWLKRLELWGNVKLEKDFQFGKRRQASLLEIRTCRLLWETGLTLFLSIMLKKPSFRVLIQTSIGRITTGLLLSIATTVDIVEPISKFTEPLSGTPGIGEIFNTGLESWTPSSDPGYDLIWNQWCLGHLTDEQLVEYFKKCGDALKEGGFVIVKENLSSGEDDVFDEVDSSVTR
jgi:hypothetical protein